MPAEYLSSQEVLNWKFERMIANASAEILEQGFKMDQIRHELYLNMSYEGSDTSLMILKPESQDFAAQFKKRHRREFNFTSDRPILVDDIRVLTIASSKVRSEKSPLQQLKEVSLRDVASPPAHSTQVYFDTAVKMRIDSPVYLLSTIEKHSRINGPAIIIDKTQTIVVTPNSTAYILDTCVLIDLQDRMTSIPISMSKTSEVDSIRLSIFAHRFMSVAKQMGNTPQKNLRVNEHKGAS